MSGGVNMKIAIVDDEKSIRSYLQEKIKQCKYFEEAVSYTHLTLPTIRLV